MKHTGHLGPTIAGSVGDVLGKWTIIVHGECDAYNSEARTRFYNKLCSILALIDIILLHGKSNIKGNIAFVKEKCVTFLETCLISRQ